MVRSTDYFFRGSGFNFLHLCGDSQFPVPGDLEPPCTDIHAGKTTVHIKINKFSFKVLNVILYFSHRSFKEFFVCSTI